MRSMQDISKKTLATVLAVAAMAPATVAGAASPGQDMRSADTRDAAAGILASPGQDMRSADTRDAAAGIVASPGHPGQDPRSPDARQPGGTQTGEPFAGAEPGAPASASDADSWTTPMILGGGLALLLIASAGVVLYSRRHTAPLPR
jgi:hypothetical protein